MEENNINNNVNENEIENTGLTTGEKLTVGAVGAAAIVGVITLGKLAYEKGKDGIGWIKKKIHKKDVPVVEEQVTNQETPQETEG